MKIKPRILVIDDDHNMRQTILEILEEEHYILAEAENGNEALLYLQNNKTDLIIVDIIMPDKDGIEVITETTMNFPHIKILCLSGGGLIDANTHLYTASQLGADDTLNKPFNNNDLVNKVKALLEHKKAVP